MQNNPGSPPGPQLGLPGPLVRNLIRAPSPIFLVTHFLQCTAVILLTPNLIQFCTKLTIDIFLHVSREKGVDSLVHHIAGKVQWAAKIIIKHIIQKYTKKLSIFCGPLYIVKTCEVRFFFVLYDCFKLDSLTRVLFLLVVV